MMARAAGSPDEGSSAERRHGHPRVSPPDPARTADLPTVRWNPRSRAAGVKRVGPACRPGPRGEEDARVALIEDDPDDQVVVRRLIGRLTEPAWELEPTGTLAAGLDRLASGGFDAVLLDLHLPDTEGLDGLRRVRGAVVDAAIVMLTGLEDDAVAREALRSGAQDYLVKSGATSSSVGRALRYAVERVRAERARQEAEALQAVNRLARAAAHEINNPLTIVSGQLQLLAEKFEREGRTCPRVGSALGALDRIRRIVVLMNQITRLETREFPSGLPEILDLWRSAGLEGDPRFPEGAG
jgi:DNA-binding response OmpR family regulator